jgi:hypothetical protein
MAVQSASIAHPDREHGARLWGAAALCAWCLLALQLSGAVEFDALNPSALAACAPRPLYSMIPPHVSPGITLVRADEQVSLAPGTLIRYERELYRLVGVDFAIQRIVLEGRDHGLIAISLTDQTLHVRPLRSGGRVGARLAGALGGLAAGVVGGVAIGSAVGSGNGTAMFRGCMIGGAVGAAAGTASTVVATRERDYPLGPEAWQVLPPSAPGAGGEAR